MTRSIRNLLLNGAMAAAFALGAFAVAGAPSVLAEEYKSKADKAKLMSGPLAAFEGMEANIVRIELPPGYQGGRHYHTGDVFVYVEAGRFTVETDGRSRTFTAGEVYHETPNVPMVARNGSSSEGATVVVFQVGEIGDPIMMKAE